MLKKHKRLQEMIAKKYKTHKLDDLEMNKLPETHSLPRFNQDLHRRMSNKKGDSVSQTL